MVFWGVPGGAGLLSFDSNIEYEYSSSHESTLMIEGRPEAAFELVLCRACISIDNT